MIHVKHVTHVIQSPSLLAPRMVSVDERAQRACLFFVNSSHCLTSPHLVGGVLGDHVRVNEIVFE